MGTTMQPLELQILLESAESRSRTHSCTRAGLTWRQVSCPYCSDSRKVKLSVKFSGATMKEADTPPLNEHVLGSGGLSVIFVLA